MIERSYPELDYEFKQSPHLVEKVSNYEYAQNLYKALCNNSWKKEGFNYNGSEPWAVTWRTAGGLVSALHHNDDRLENYMEFYCSGGEGHVDEEIQQDLYELGWTWEPIEE
jgi:hypothetical protein